MRDTGPAEHNSAGFRIFNRQGLVTGASGGY